MFNVLNVDKYDNFKNVHLERDGYQYTVTCFPDFTDYDTLETGKTVEGYIRIKGHYQTLVDYKKPERNWLGGEKFI